MEQFLEITNSCSGCQSCLSVCPFNAILKDTNSSVIDQYECTQCDICTEVCPEGAIRYRTI